jgi:hypothetical protein
MHAEAIGQSMSKMPVNQMRVNYACKKCLLPLDVVVPQNPGRESL